MKGLSTKAVEIIERLISNKFDSFNLSFLGMVPKISKTKSIIFSTSKNSLVSLFLQALGSKNPDNKEEEVLKVMLRIASSYIDSLRDNTKAKVVNQINSYVLDQNAKSKDVSTDRVKSILREGVDKSTHHLKMIVNSESNKITNAGTALQISKVGVSNGEEDPTVFFIVTVDDVTGSEEFRLHLLPDRKTPRLWKLSEIGNSYHKKGENNPKLSGLHPNCFTENQKIYTENGLLTFKELFDSQENPKVMVDGRIVNRRVGNNQFGKEIEGKVWLNPHGQKQARFLPATPVYYTDKQEVLRITQKSGHVIEVTKNHEMWVRVGNTKWAKKEAKDLVVGDKLPLAAYSECFGQDDFQDFAELMGNLSGDGTFDEDRLICTWNFFGNDIEYGNKLLAIKNKYKSKMSFNEVETLKIYPQNDKYGVERACMASRTLGVIFKEQFNFTKKPRRVPERLFKANKKTVSAYLRGLYAADGHSEPSSVVLAQNDKEFLRQIQTLLSMFGLVSSIYKHGDAVTKEITYSDGTKHLTNRKECWRLIMSGHSQFVRFIEEIGFGVEVKQEKAIANIGKSNKSRSNYITSSIAEIEEIGVQDTYCITEPMTNTVTVEGIVTGQCRCKLTYLPRGFGFNSDGKVAWKGFDHDELKYQRDNFEAPSELPMKKSERDISWKEHPNNASEPDESKHMISHIANNGKEVWKQKNMTWGGRKVTPEDMDNLHRASWKSYANNNKVAKGTDLSNTLTSLNKMVVNDNDRHLKVAKTSGHPDPRHQEIRQRHLIYALGGQEGYSVEDMKHPQTQQHMGVRIKAPRHHKDGNLGETSWIYDGKSLKTEYDKITGKRWK